MSKPLIAIVGRPNVGKSTLFNRLLQRRVAIEDDLSGVTRDRISSDLEWNGVVFTLVDTGGLVSKAEKDIDRLVSQAAEAAILEADKLVMVVDGKVGPSDADYQVAKKVLRSKIPAILAVTKLDSAEHEPYAAEFYSLGLGDPFAVSGISGLNSGDLLDAMVDGFDMTDSEEPALDEIRLALVGRPNVGKSSLLNRLVGEEKQIVSEIPGTTRDAIDHTMSYMKQTIRLVDTAGLKRSRELHKESLEYYTALRTIRAVNRCHVAAILLDASTGLTQQDRRLIDDIRSKRKGLVVVVNKWDLVEKDSNTMVEFEREFRLQLPDLSFVPLVFMSALTGKRARKVLDVALEVFEERNKRIPTNALNVFIQKVIERQPPPSIKGKWLKIKFVNQVSDSPPLFAFFLNYPKLVPDSYKKFLERCIREEYGFAGVPLKVVFRQK